MRSRTLGQKVADRDAARFVGRKDELAKIEELLVEEPAANVIFIHGPAGIGKSSLLRELERRAAARGYSIHRVDGRDQPPGPDALEDAFVGARAETRPLLVIDTYERITALGGYLRRAILPTLAPEAVVVIASRLAPEPGWGEGGWDQVTTVLKLAPLSREEAQRVLRHAGMEPASAGRLVAWAGGWPLALTLGAQLADGDGASDGSGLDGLLDALTRRITDSEWNPAHSQALAVGAIARVVTPALLRDALPDQDAQAEYDWLSTRSFVEPLGEGVALHELLRVALRRRLGGIERASEHELRRRICDHLYARARQGDRLLAIDLSELSRNSAIRWGFSWEGGGSLRLDDVRDSDLAELERALGERGGHVGQVTRAFFEQAPEHISVIRDDRDALAGYTIALTPESAPSFCEQDDFLGPRLEHAREHNAGASAVLWRDVVDLTGDPESGVVAMLGMAGVLRAPRGNPRYAYLVINADIPAAVEFSRALGAVHLPELDLKRQGARIQCHLLDYGPGGLVRAERDLVYRELGLEPPTAIEQDSADPVELVRDCLRHFDEPGWLAASPLATGATADERAASVRELLSDSIERAFGSRVSDQLTKRVLIRAYIDRAPTLELAADELHLSRSAFFRRLKLGTERLAEYACPTAGSD